MFDMRGESVRDLMREWKSEQGGAEDIDSAVMGLVLLMVRAQQMARGDRLNALSGTVEYPPITEDEVWGWRN